MKFGEIIFAVALNVYARTEWLREQYKNFLTPKERREVDHSVVLTALKNNGREYSDQDIDNILKYLETELNSKGSYSLYFDTNGNIIHPEPTNYAHLTLNDKLNGLLHRNPYIIALGASAAHASLYYAGRRMLVDESPSDAFHESMLGAAPMLLYSAYENLKKAVQYDRKTKEEDNHSFGTSEQMKLS